MGGRCLIVVDMLRDFIEPDGALYCGEGAQAIVPRVRELLEEFRSRGEPVIFLADRHDEDDPEFRLFARHAVAGTRGAEFVDELAPREGEEVVAKKHLGPFYRTRLEEVIAAVAPEEAHVCGVCTSICVMEAAGDLSDRGIGVVVHTDAVADIDPELEECALKRMKRVYKARMEPDAGPD